MSLPHRRFGAQHRFRFSTSECERIKRNVASGDVSCNEQARRLGISAGMLKTILNGTYKTRDTVERPSPASRTLHA